MGRIAVATHNLMRGIFLHELARCYRLLRETHGLDILCLQENLPGAFGVPSVVIARTLGSDFEIASPGPSDCVIVFRRRLVCRETFMIPLPLLRRFTFFERFWSAEGRPQAHAAVAAVFSYGNGEPFTVVSFHLDAQGTTNHRRAQTQAIAQALTTRGRERRLILCGDTNARAHPSNRQLCDLARTLTPFSPFGINDCGTEPTHFLSRLGEKRLSHRLFWLIGKLGYDRLFPQRLDVLCSNLPVMQEHNIAIPFSDHNILWAEIDIA